jgi:phosphoglycolate phosphatase
MPRFLDSYDLFVFDLDGTLADTRADLTESVNHALEAQGSAPLSMEEVTRYVGNGAKMLMQRALGATATARVLERALTDFLQHYTEHCTERTVLYPGTREALRGLAGKDLAVLSNKPSLHSRKILSALGVEDVFARIEGGDSFPQKKPDPAGLLAVARDLGHPLDRTLVVGDSEVDIQTARAAGARAAFVTYGFRPEALTANAPDYVLRDLRELLGPAETAAFR